LTINSPLSKKQSHTQKKKDKAYLINRKLSKVLTAEKRMVEYILPLVSSLRGIFKAPESFVYKKELSK
jgi:hypothetical protein